MDYVTLQFLVELLLESLLAQSLAMLRQLLLLLELSKQALEFALQPLLQSLLRFGMLSLLQPLLAFANPSASFTYRRGACVMKRGKEPNKDRWHIGHRPDEAVGYKNPPQEFQFQKGQSGNPKGRPKGSKNKPRFSNGEVMASVFTSVVRDMSHHFLAKLKAYERAYNPAIQAQRKRQGLAPVEEFPKLEDCHLSPDTLTFFVFGPISADENKVWRELLRREKELIHERNYMLYLKRTCKDGEDARQQLQEAADKKEVFLKQVQAEKEKFRREVFNPSMSRRLFGDNKT